MAEQSKPETRRLFIAVMLPPEVRERLARSLRVLDAHRDALRPVRPEALHFTLRFLGNLSAEMEQRAAGACAAAVEGVAPFPLVVGGYGAFPSARRVRVVWLGLREGADALNALHRRVQDELLHRGVVADAEAFTPHLTLARVRQDAAPAARAALGTTLAAVSDDEQAHCTADAVSLVHSTLTPRGSRYDIVGTWQLG